MKPIGNANVVAPQLGLGTVTDQNGLFELCLPAKSPIQIQVSCIGYASLDTLLTAESPILISFSMCRDILALSEISVIAEEKAGLETTSVIKQSAMKHLQPSSMADIFQLLPGGTASENNLTTMRLPTLREAGSASNSDYTSSLGTAFMMDGHLLSNDVQMQSVSGAYDAAKGVTIKKRDATGKGMDMRLLSTDDIESVEIIRGVPSAKYGDLTSGVVSIKRSYSRKPVKMRFKSRPTEKLFSIGKGLAIDSLNTLNADLSYIRYENDPRNQKLTYTRYTTSLRYRSQKVQQANPMVLKVNLDYTGAFDRERIDPEVDYVVTDRYDKDYHNLRLGTELNWEVVQLSWWDQLVIRLSGNYVSEQTEIDRLVSAGRIIPMAYTLEEGVHDGIYLPPSYQTHVKVDGQPFYLNSALYSSHPLQVFASHHQVSWGANYAYKKNFGNGELFDPLRPPFHGMRVDPVQPNDLPSLQQLAFFAEDVMKVSAGSSELNVMAGLRGVMALNLSEPYAMKGHIYWEPRFNATWSFPAFMLGNYRTKISLVTGYGQHHKLPTLMHLYPKPYYVDFQQLNYYSSNAELSRLNYKTYKEQPASYDLRPAQNTKKEIGIRIKSDRCKLVVTYFNERMTSGFKRLSQLKRYTYTDYDESSVSAVDLTGPPELDQFQSEEKNYQVGSYEWRNGGLNKKEGLEYELDFGTVVPLSSRITVRGAWFKSTYDQSLPEYRRPGIVLDGADYPYMGLYSWDDGSTYTSLNTNVRGDTDLNPLGLIFSSELQTVWFKSRQRNAHNGRPDYYVDQNGTHFPYTSEHINDPVLTHLYKKPSESLFAKDKETIAIALNLTVSKTINKHIDFSFFVYNLLDYTPAYYRNSGVKVERRVYPRFGMELNVKL